VEKISLLLDNPELLNTMKKNARIYMANRSFEAAFNDLWDMYKDPVNICRTDVFEN
jgi:hypothetical protein